ncbi:MAG: hypothetical protein IJ496_06510 [Ruminococcus sp.]|nr:hypothetical protein [Ruminococcus sp.]
MKKTVIFGVIACIIGLIACAAKSKQKNEALNDKYDRLMKDVVANDAEADL